MTETPQRVAAWSLLIGILLLTLALGANRPPAWMALSGLALLAGVLCLPGLAQLDQVRVRALVVPGLAYFAVLTWALAQTLPGAGPALAHPHWAPAVDGMQTIAADPMTARHHVLRLAGYGAAFLVAALAARDRTVAKAFLTAIAVFGAALSAFGIIAVGIGWNPILADRANGFVSASFLNRGAFASFAVMTFLCNLAMALRVFQAGNAPGTNWITRFFSGGWIFCLGAILAGVALVMSGSRAGAASLGLGAIILLATTARSRKELRLRLGISILGTVALALVAGSALTARLGELSTGAARFDVYWQLFASLSDRPILGNGLAGFRFAFAEHISTELAFGEWRRAHNSFLENAFELGIPATILLYLSPLLLLRNAPASLKTGEESDPISMCALACLAAAGFHALFDFSFQFPSNTALLAFIMGIGWTRFFHKNARVARLENRNSTGNYS